MRAIGYKTALPIDDENALVDIVVPRPSARGRDLLVEVRAISVNPVDVKIRANVQPANGDWRILGWDASGNVVEAGPEASRFKPGDEVYFAGDLTRQGTNAEFVLVVERIVGHKPKTLDWAAAAALPLTAITAWEALFDRLTITGKKVPGASRSLLIIGGAGGVGSIAIQLARQLSDLTIIATASRQETRDWVLDLGAHHVIDHSQPLARQIVDLGLGSPGFVFSTTNTDQHFAEIVELMAPQGHLALIDDPKSLDINPLKRKSIATHWEFMFTRSMFATADMEEQGRLLNEVAQLVDQGILRSTQAEEFGPINAENLRRAHALLESGKARGKITLQGF